MNGVAQYRAKADCRAGGFYRKTGEVFTMRKLENVPAHLEEIGAHNMTRDDSGTEETKRAKTRGTVPKSARVTRNDIGAGSVKSVADVTSTDMVKP